MRRRRCARMARCAGAGWPPVACAAAIPGTPAGWTTYLRAEEPMDTQRLVLFFIFSFSLLLLWDAWMKEQQPKPSAPTVATAPAGTTGGAVPAPAKPAAGAPPAATPAPQVASTAARGTG